MAITIEVGGKLDWLARRSLTGGGWIAECPPMGLSVDAPTLDELHSVINETIANVLADLVADNELDQFLRERGWTRVSTTGPDRPDMEFNLPWHLIAEGRLGSDGRTR